MNIDSIDLDMSGNDVENVDNLSAKRLIMIATLNLRHKKMSF